MQLKNDYNRLESKYEETTLERDQGAKKVKQSEDEMSYLKKHFEIELGLLKDENEILKRELQELNLRAKKM